MTHRKKEQNNFGRFFTSRIFLLLICLIAMLMAFSYARAYYQDYAIRQEIIRLEDEVRRLEYKKLESLELLQYVTENEYVEEKARVEFNLKKPGEHVIRIQEGSVLTFDEHVADSDTQERHLINPIRWWYYFTHREINNN